jgi:hypothetical protein
MDVLREASDSELDFITAKLSQKLPYTIKDLHYILATRRIKSLSTNIDNVSVKASPTFFIPREGVKENCTVCGITDEKDHCVWFFTFQESLAELRECLQKTKRIKWNTSILFVTIHREHVGPIFELVSDVGVFSVVNYPASYFFYPLEDALRLKVE